MEAGFAGGSMVSSALPEETCPSGFVTA